MNPFFEAVIGGALSFSAVFLFLIADRLGDIALLLQRHTTAPHEQED